MIKRQRSAVFVAAVLFTGLAAAHPPSGIDLEFDASQRMLTVRITHPTRDAAKHFIDRVILERNDAPAAEQVITFQADDEVVRLCYIIPDAEPGDTLAVTAHCNVFGKKKAIHAIQGD